MNELREKIVKAIDDNQDEVDWVNTHKATTEILEVVIATLPEELPNNPNQESDASAYDAGYNQSLRDVKFVLHEAAKRYADEY